MEMQVTGDFNFKKLDFSYPPSWASNGGNISPKPHFNSLINSAKKSDLRGLSLPTVIGNSTVKPDSKVFLLHQRQKKKIDGSKSFLITDEAKDFASNQNSRGSTSKQASNRPEIPSLNQTKI